MSTAVAIPEVEEQVRAGDESRDELARLYHVILLDDDDHTYEYVIEMLTQIFAFSEQKAYEHTVEVDTHGHTRLITCSLEEAEKKRDQVHAFGPDWRLPRSLGSMAALIEPVR
jgi:ATP-dependent Clp protease adaptor protein ClpS